MRRLGAQDAMEDAGLTFDDRLYGLSNYDFESAYHAMNSLLARRAEFTALFAMSDVIAFGAIRALVSAGFGCRKMYRSSASTASRCPATVCR